MYLCGVNAEESSSSTLKLRTAHTLKWNTLDRISQQIALAVIGVVLANILSEEDYGLTGIVAMFQAFAIVFVDSGFGAALLQKKVATEEDYSTVFWFNFSVSIGIYIILWFAAPLIALLFHSEELLWLSRVMFISFIFNALGIVQTNRLMKQMDVRQIALSNLVGVIVAGALGIYLAVAGFGAWALVWQAIALSAIKTAWLWIAVRWRPRFLFSRTSMRSIWRVGLGVFSSSLLNTFFLNLYTVVIGFRSLGMLGVYTQAEKWSKMGTASLSQIITATFVPLLARFQDSVADFHRYMRRIDRFAALCVFPAMAGLAVVATPLFHTLFGNKWDAAIIMFQILSVRGIFIIFISVYNNFLLSGGHAKALVMVEFAKDATMLIALVITIFMGSIVALVWGQLIAAVATWIYVLFLTSRKTGLPMRSLLADLVRPALLCAAALAGGRLLSLLLPGALLQLAVAIVTAVTIYLLLMKLFKVPELTEARQYLLGKLGNKKTPQQQ